MKGIKFGEADLISSSKGTQRNFGESERNSEVAVEAAVQRLQWRQQYSGCSGGSNSAVAVEAAVQRLQCRQQYGGCSGGSNSAIAVEAAVVVEIEI